jgi:hypothetical protein
MVSIVTFLVVSTLALSPILMQLFRERTDRASRVPVRTRELADEPLLFSDLIYSVRESPIEWLIVAPSFVASRSSVAVFVMIGCKLQWGLLRAKSKSARAAADNAYRNIFGRPLVVRYLDPRLSWVFLWPGSVLGCLLCGLVALLLSPLWLAESLRRIVTPQNPVFTDLLAYGFSIITLVLLATRFLGV